MKILKKGLLIFGIAVIILIIILTIHSKNKTNSNETGGVSQNESGQKGPVDLSKTVVVEEEYSEKIGENERLNTSPKLKEEKEYKGLKFTNIKLAKKNGNTMLIADVENNSDRDLISGEKIKIVFKDTKGNEIEEIDNILPAIKKGAKGQLNSNIATASNDIVNAYNFEIKEAN